MFLDCHYSAFVLYNLWRENYLRHPVKVDIFLRPNNHSSYIFNSFL